jgi:hypothetical protein
MGNRKLSGFVSVVLAQFVAMTMRQGGQHYNRGVAFKLHRSYTPAHGS